MPASPMPSRIVMTTATYASGLKSASSPTPSQCSSGSSKTGASAKPTAGRATIEIPTIPASCPPAVKTVRRVIVSPSK